jgi:hypothetical protein
MNCHTSGAAGATACSGGSPGKPRNRVPGLGFERGLDGEVEHDEGNPIRVIRRGHGVRTPRALPARPRALLVAKCQPPACPINPAHVTLVSHLSASCFPPRVPAQPPFPPRMAGPSFFLAPLLSLLIHIHEQMLPVHTTRSHVHPCATPRPAPQNRTECRNETDQPPQLPPQNSITSMHPRGKLGMEWNPLVVLFHLPRFPRSPVPKIDRNLSYSTRRRHGCCAVKVLRLGPWKIL